MHWKKQIDYLQMHRLEAKLELQTFEDFSEDVGDTHSNASSQ